MTEPSAPIQLHVASRSHVGLKRDGNEDRALVATFAGEAYAPPWDGTADVTKTGALLAVCDGMGGAAGGEIASSEAVEVLRARLARPLGARTDSAAVASRLVDALRVAARTIFDHAVREPALTGMGTTATVATMVDRRLIVAQVGDSRAYLLRDGVLTQITRDQTLARLLVERGQLTEEEALRFEASNVILQAVGTSLHLDVDLRDVEVQGGDVLLLCSDGLSGPVGDACIAEVLARNDDPERACDALIAAALEAGAPDNVTCIVARVHAPDANDAGPPVARRVIFEPPSEDEPPPTEPAPPSSRASVDASVDASWWSRAIRRLSDAARRLLSRAHAFSGGFRLVGLFRARRVRMQLVDPVVGFAQYDARCGDR